MDDSSDGGKERERERWVAIGGHVCHSHFLLLFLLFSSDQELLLPHLSILLGVSVNSFLFLWHRTMHWRARSNDFAMLGMQRHYACASRTLLGTDEQPDPRYVPRRWPRDDRPHQLAVFLRIELPSRCLYACVQLRTYIGIRTAYFFLRTVDSWSARRIDTCPPTRLSFPFRPHFAPISRNDGQPKSIFTYLSHRRFEFPFSTEIDGGGGIFGWKKMEGTRRQVGDNRQTRLTLRGAKRCRR